MSDKEVDPGPDVAEASSVDPVIQEVPKQKSTSLTLGLVGVFLQLGWWILVIVILVAPQALNGMGDGAFLVLFLFIPFPIAGFVLSIISIVTRKGAGRLVGIVGTVVGILALVGYVLWGVSVASGVSPPVVSPAGTTDSATLEADLLRSYPDITTVDCSTTEDFSQGAQFDCRANGPDGVSYLVGTFTDNEGSYIVNEVPSLGTFHVNVEGYLTDSFGEAGTPLTQVDCPEDAEMTPGLDFHCIAATSDDQYLDVTVHIEDDGSFSWEGGLVIPSPVPTT